MSNIDFGDDDADFMAVDLDAIEKAAASSSASSTKNPQHSADSNAAKRRKILSPKDESLNRESNNQKNYSTHNSTNKPSQQTSSNTSTTATASELKETLSKFFGYPDFRPGQLEIVQAALKGEDVAVFMATGSGKSICYQIPALHNETITFVVSPLISLMQDQVHKLNGLFFDGNNELDNLATFLGSGQSDVNQERKALNGAFRLVYITPEKLLSAGFLDRLLTLHTSKRKIGLIAIDEAHCVSEWGHDFRADFRKIGQVLRTQAAPELRNIPIMALTATAVPRVQTDICSSLHLRQPKIMKFSFDRSNLFISVHQKDRGMALASALEPLVQTLMESTQPSQQSTIIYVPTRNQVDDTVSFLRQRLQKCAKEVHVQGYHAGLSHAERESAHTNFLTGKTTVICATVAFGMGIDKSDTRRVIHFGSPKTVEEYYQQIGRAGRDGLAAECTMFVSSNDFDKYNSDFYLGNLSGQAKDAVLASIAALKKFSLDGMTCRRKALLEFFSETPKFGDRCGTCDNCKKVNTLDDDDLERDFGNLGARVVLQAVDALKEQGISTIISVISGKTLDSYRYRGGILQDNLKKKMLSRKETVGKKLSLDSFRELIVPLTQRGYLQESSKSAVIQGYSKSWTIYKMTNKGRSALLDDSIPIPLPVPDSVLEAERKEKARRQRVLAQLEESGVKLESIPQDELKTGDGEVIRALSKWNSYLANLRKNGKDQRVSQLEELLAALESWRAQTAIKFRMAPGSVLAEHTLLTIAYTVATLPRGMKMEESALVAAGVRTREMSSLCQTLTDWIDKYQASLKDGNAAAETSGHDVMQFQPGLVKGTAAWEFAVYKPVKKTGLASWESSYNRFLEGESPQAIALSPANGRPIQVRTVCCHIIQALLYGKPVDLHRLAEFFPPPTSNEYAQMEAAELSTGINSCGNPLNCGVDGGKFAKTDFLRPIMGDHFIDTPYTEREEDDKVKFGSWCDRLEWYLTLRRIGHQPTFGPS